MYRAELNTGYEHQHSLSCIGQLASPWHLSEGLSQLNCICISQTFVCRGQCHKAALQEYVNSEYKVIRVIRLQPQLGQQDGSGRSREEVVRNSLASQEQHVQLVRERKNIEYASDHVIFKDRVHVQSASRGSEKTMTA